MPIRSGLAGNICRCTGYVRHRRRRPPCRQAHAGRHAGHHRRGSGRSELTVEVRTPRLGVSHPKSDNVALLTGTARFTSDIALPGMLHGHIVRSPYAHARVVSFDAGAARALPGVVDVIGPDDVRDLPRFSLAHVKDQAVLAWDRVRFVGDPVAAVFADSLEAARSAAELVDVVYEELPFVLSGEAALAPDAPRLHEGIAGVEGNVCWRQSTRAGDIEAAFREADLVVRERFETSKAHAMPMETHAALASWDPAEGSSRCGHRPSRHTCCATSSRPSWRCHATASVSSSRSWAAPSGTRRGSIRTRPSPRSRRGAPGGRHGSC